MTTMQVLGVGYRAARAAARERRRARGSSRTGSVAHLVVEHGLAIAGFTCFTAAAAMVAIPLGLVVAGIGMFILELRAGE